MSGNQATEDVRADIAAALAESGVASLARGGAPVLVVEGAPLRLVHANAAALALFSADSLFDLREGALAPDAPAIRAVAERLRCLPTGASRIERFDFGPIAKITFLCRRANADTALYVLAGLGVRLREAPPRQAAAAADVPDTRARHDLRRAFERRYPGLKPARFLWRTDARNVVTEVTAPLADIFGGAAASLIGRDLIEVTRDLGVDPDGRLAAALDSRATFSGVEVIWPIEGAHAAAPVSLGALPAFDREKGFDGWRGFGVIQLDRLQDKAPPAESRPTSRDEAAREPAPDFSGVVLPFPPARALAAFDSREEPAALVTLAPHERQAFREIARTLGAKGETEKGETEKDEARPPRDLANALEEPAPIPAEAAPPGGALDDAFDSFPVGLAIRRDGAWVCVNRTLLDWLGCADLREFVQAVGAAVSGEAILATRGGQDLAVEIETAPTRWGALPAEAVTVRRTPQKRVEERMEERIEARIAALETTLRQRDAEAADVMAILKASADGVALFNADGDLLGLSEAAEKLFGRSRDDRGDLRDLIAPESRADIAAALARLTSGAAAAPLRVSGLSGSGAALALQVSFVRMADAGKYCAVFRAAGAASAAIQDAAIEDAPPQDAAPQEGDALREATRRAEVAEAENRAKTDYLSAVTHELRTPLNAILGFAEVIMDERFGPIGNARYKEYLKDIHASGAHVMSLVNDLLDLSKIEAGKLDLNFAAVDANQVVAECVSLIQPQANRERVITRLALAPALPLALADERALRQIVLNLLANAVRYNEPGGQVIVSTSVATSASGQSKALLRVKDTGVGMNEAELRAALEPFRQVSSKAGGTGLGLPLTKALAEANHADFVIRSRKNEGTLVEVGFPLAPEALVARSLATAAPAPGPASRRR
ncbi:Signal transduction histidine kinase [Rhodoblastus acidophilus]|uniref:histidine kinase n=1 Tax=Rhodoblastus acidophilus TaxID=1074 RepID=A0A212RZ83_RHOAC|nr:PAS domain-containing sensor histidine kinase [Rhodoblastus acidophilus]SNB78180.1 Signal transduction histidine kinase [Rhodoblastus acidophilus]